MLRDDLHSLKVPTSEDERRQMLSLLNRLIARIEDFPALSGLPLEQSLHRLCVLLSYPIGETSGRIGVGWIQRDPAKRLQAIELQLQEIQEVVSQYPWLLEMESPEDDE